MRKFIGLDLGDVRIGVAKSDTLGILATSLCVINREKEDSYKKILEICEEIGTYKIVVGKPLRLNGNSEIQVEKVEKYMKKLKEMDERIEVIYIDERYTTKQAEIYLRNSKKNAKQKRQVVDMLAASIILQTHLDRLK